MVFFFNIISNYLYFTETRDQLTELLTETDQSGNNNDVGVVCEQKLEVREQLHGKIIHESNTEHHFPNSRNNVWLCKSVFDARFQDIVKVRSFLYIGGLNEAVLT